MSRRLDDVPADDAWLTAAERDTLARLHVPKRRADWLLGRWTAKAAVVAWLAGRSSDQLPPGALIEVRPADDGAPEVFAGGEPLPVSISITHRAWRAVVAVAAREVAVGCDLELVEERRSVFLEDFFTDSEVHAAKRLSEPRRSEAVTRLWAVKEASLKALRKGLRIDTRRLEVHPLVPGDPGAVSGGPLGGAGATPLWERMSVLVASSDRARAARTDPGRGDRDRQPVTLEGWWCRIDTALLAVVADPPSPVPPRRL